MEKEQFEELLQKIGGISEGIRLISERQNSQYTDIMMILKEVKDQTREKQTETEPIEDKRTTEELYDEAFKAVTKSGKASTSLIQRKLGIGYSKAAELIDMLEEKKIISEGIGSKPRKILIKPEGI